MGCAGRLAPILICHRYTGTTPSPPPGSHYTSPSENMWNTGSTYNLSSGMAVAGEWGRPRWGEGAAAPTRTLTLTPVPAGMPAAYDLSSVIAGGSSVGHNNLIPLGESLAAALAGMASSPSALCLPGARA